MRRLLGTIVVLIGIVIIIGIWRDWFQFRSHSNDDHMDTFSVDVNRQKLREDTAAAEKSARHIGDRIRENAEGILPEHSASGRIAHVWPMDKDLRIVTSENKELALKVEPNTKIIENEQAMQLDGLREGERVWVVYAIKDGKNVARSITILPAS